jgi:hypothetical protein
MKDLWAAFVCTQTANHMYEAQIKTRQNFYGESLLIKVSKKTHL